MNFYQSALIGEQWEQRMEQWMEKYFSKSNWFYEDARFVHRDDDGDQFPDYLLINKKTDKFCFIDAKKRNAYNIGGEYYFGFDEKFYRSYTNIAAKHNSVVYVGFNDPQFDPKHVYVLDVAQACDKRIWFDNAYGKGHAYRWKIDSLSKFEI